MALFEHWLISNDDHRSIWLRALLLVESECTERIDFSDIETLASGHLARHGTTDSFLFIPDRDGASRVRPAQAAFAFTTGPDSQVHLKGECSLCRKTGCRHIAAGVFAAVASVRPDFLSYVVKAQSQTPLSQHAAAFLHPFFASAPIKRDSTPRGRLAYVLVELPGRNLIGHLSLEYWQASGGKTQRTLLDVRSLAHLLGFPSPELKATAVQSLNALAACLPTTDLRCLRQIYTSGAMGLQPGHVCLSVDGAHLIVELALATNHLVHDSNPRARHKHGAPRSFQLAWSRSETGHSSLNPTISPAGLLVPTTPPWYLDPIQLLIGPAQGRLSPQLASALPHAAELSDSDLSAIFDYMLVAGTDHGLPESPNYERVDAGLIRPTPCLHLYFKPANPDFDPHRRQSSSTGFILAELTFDYRGNNISAMDLHSLETALNSKEQAQLVEVKNRQRIIILRDLAFELETVEALLEIVPRRLAASGPFHLLHGEYWADSFRTAARPIIKNVTEFITSLCGRVTSAVNFIDTGSEANKFIFEASNPDGTWLDFGISADIGGQRRDITNALRRILLDPKMIHDIIASDHSEYVIQVERDVWAAVPQESLKGLIPLFKALIFDRTTGPARLSRVHSGAVSEAQRALNAEIIAPSNLQDLIQRLNCATPALHQGTLEWLSEPARLYQQEAAAWCAARRAEGLGGVIADEYAVGKTLQGLLTVSDAYFETGTPSLVVVTKTLFVDRKWQLEAKRFLPAMRIIEVRSSRDLAALDDLEGVAMVVTTYNNLALNSEAFRDVQWNVVLSDEGHKLGNQRTLFHTSFDSLLARQKIIITGSPLINSPTEIWALMNLCVPGLLYTRAWFDRTFPKLKRVGTNNDGEPEHSSLHNHDDHHERMKALGRLIAPFQLRRTNASLNRTLPPIVEERRAVILSRAEADLYDLVRLTTQSQLQSAFQTLGAPLAKARMLPLLLRMRQVCADWRLLKDSSMEMRGPSAKSEAIVEICEEFASDGKLVMITSEWSEWLKLLHQDLANAGIASSLVIGEIGGDRARSSALDAYRSGRNKVLLLQLAMAEGFDLPQTDVHVIAEPWWNRAREDQATARARRDERDKTVTVIRVHVVGSVEDGVEMVATSKKADLMTINSGADDIQPGILTDAQIEMMLKPLQDIDAT